jgi:hypothetical protein
LSVEKSVTLPEEEYQDAIAVAKYQHRTFSAYARHCIAVETKRRIKEVMATQTPSNASGAGKPQ